jgi:predicted dienelactone hydrolase
MLRAFLALTAKDTGAIISLDGEIFVMGGKSFFGLDFADPLIAGGCQRNVNDDGSRIQLTAVEIKRRRHFWFALFCCVLSLLCACRPAFGSSSLKIFKVGISDRSFVPNGSYDWRAAQTHALLVTIWYPASPSAVARTQTLGPPGAPLFIAGSAAPDAKLTDLPHRFPLVLLSHGTGGSAMQLAWLGNYLAAHGYIAAAVNHPGDNALEPYTLQGFMLWWLRARDLGIVLDRLLADPVFGPRIDKSRVGAAGFSLGGYTMIELAGGVTNPQSVLDYCDSPRSHGTCNIHEFPDLARKAKQLLKTDSSFAAAFARGNESYRDSRIRAVFCIAPALGVAFSPETLTNISVPVEIVAGAADPIAPPPDNAEYLAHHIRHAKITILPGGVAHYTFLDSCGPAGKKNLPVYCADARGVDRQRVHEEVAAMAARFFDANLR